ncbi:MAG: hypothetical protein LC733_11185 [Actinobacteria bacterium]|nr:hypothetical protein [Actinomycetota bacterium]
MADQAGNEIAVADDEAEAEVEGFNGINTTRDNIPRRPRPASATAPATAPAVGDMGLGRSEYAIKEQGIK